MTAAASLTTTRVADETVRQPISRFKRICVFCCSSQGKRMIYRDAAIDLAKQLVSRGIDLVYGGGSTGLISEAVFRGGRHVTGVIPMSSLVTGEITGEKMVGEVRLVADMHQRKAEMARQSDGFIALPGGYGTLEELFEVMTWAQLGIHRKPIGLLHVDGYYDSLIAFIDHAVGEGFISPRARGIFISASTAQKLMDKIEEYIPYYDIVASGLKWETRITKEADEGSGNGTASLKPRGRVFNTSEGILSDGE